MGGKPIMENEQARETFLEGSASVFSVLAIGLFTLTFVFQNFVIPSSSMASTLLVGDHVVVERGCFGLKPRKVNFAAWLGSPALNSAGWELAGKLAPRKLVVRLKDADHGRLHGRRDRG